MGPVHACVFFLLIFCNTNSIDISPDAAVTGIPAEVLKATWASFAALVWHTGIVTVRVVILYLSNMMIKFDVR